jgi:hypothetical protein
MWAVKIRMSLQRNLMKSRGRHLEEHHRQRTHLHGKVVLLPGSLLISRHFFVAK